MSQAVSHSAFNAQLKKYYSFYTGGFIAFLIFLAIAEQMGMSRAMMKVCTNTSSSGTSCKVKRPLRPAEYGVSRSVEARHVRPS